MAGRAGGDLGLHGIDGNGLPLALDPAEDFSQQLLGVGAGHSGRRRMNRHALLAHRGHVEAVGRKLLGNLIEDDALARRKIDNDRLQQPLAGDLALATGENVLLKENPLMGHVLVDQP